MSWLFLAVTEARHYVIKCPHPKFKDIGQWFDFQQDLCVAAWAKLRLAMEGDRYNLFRFLYDIGADEGSHFRTHLLMIPGYIPWFILGVVIVIGMLVWMKNSQDDI